MLFLLCPQCGFIWYSRVITNAFQKILDGSGRKPNKIWVGKSSESWLQDNDTEMYSRHNEGKYVAVERFIRTLKNEIDKYMTSISEICILIIR